MMKALIINLLITNILFASSSKIYNAYAIGIFDENGNGENIQKKRKSTHDYNGICFSKIFVNSKYNKNPPKVLIGNSIGHFQSSKSIYNKKRLKIGEVLTFKHYNVKEGYLKVIIKNNIYDMKTFIK